MEGVAVCGYICEKTRSPQMFIALTTGRIIFVTQFFFMRICNCKPFSKWMTSDETIDAE